MVKIVDAELKIEVSEDIRAANMTAIIKPLMPKRSKNWTFSRIEAYQIEPNCTCG